MMKLCSFFSHYSFIDSGGRKNKKRVEDRVLETPNVHNRHVAATTRVDRKPTKINCGFTGFCRTCVYAHNDDEN